MIYLNVSGRMILANVNACAHTPRTFARTTTVIRCLIWLSLYGGCRVTDFSVNLPLSATQVHVKARSSCITADEKKRFFFIRIFISFILSAFLISPFFLLSSLLCVFFRTQLRVVRACIQCLKHMERCMYRNHI